MGSRGWMGHAEIVYHFENGVLHTIEGNRVPKDHGFDYVLFRMEKLLGYGHAEGQGAGWKVTRGRGELNI